MAHVRFAVEDDADAGDGARDPEKVSVRDAGRHRSTDDADQLRERISELERQNDELEAVIRKQSRVSLRPRTRMSTMSKFAKIVVEEGAADEGDEDDDMEGECQALAETKWRLLWQMAIRSVVARCRRIRMTGLVLKAAGGALRDLDAKDQQISGMRTSADSASPTAREAELRARKRAAESEAKHQEERAILLAKIEMLESRRGSMTMSTFSSGRATAMSEELGELFSDVDPDELERVKERAQEMEQELAKALEQEHELRFAIRELQCKLAKAEDKIAGSSWSSIFCCKGKSRTSGAAGEAEPDDSDKAPFLASASADKDSTGATS